MAIAVANSWGTSAGSTNTVTATISGVATGELLIAIALGFGNISFTWNSPAFTDNGTGSAWTNRGESGYVTRSRVQIGETVVGSAAPTTVTCTASAGCTACGIVVFRVTGAAAASTHDASVGGGQVSATPAAPALTTTNANDLLIVGVTHDGSLTTITKPTGFTNGPIDTSVTNVPYGSASQVVSATQSAATYAWALGASRNAVMVAGAWQAASASAVTDPKTFSAIPFQAQGRNL